METKILRKLFCPKCVAMKTFKVLDPETGRGKCPTCGFTRFLPMGHAAEVAEADRAEETAEDEE